MTARHSSIDMLKKKRSRRMPALLTTASSLPKLSMQKSIMRCADCHSATLSVFATAFPPCLRISSTTFCAGPASRPSPCTEAPRSLTTTDAPAAAMASAKSRPMPPPAPVTSATLPFSIAASIPEAGIAALDQPQQTAPLQLADLAPLAGLVAVVGCLHNIISGDKQFLRRPHGKYLRLARPVEPIHRYESFG